MSKWGRKLSGFALAVLAAAGVTVCGAGVSSAETGPGVILGSVWFDRDNDRVIDSDEPGRAGAEVIAHNELSGVDSIVYTGADGSYRLTGLPVGDYEVTAPDAGYRSTIPNTHARTLTAEHPQGYEAFGQQGGGAAGRAWDDTNGNGIREAGEPRRAVQFTLIGKTDYEGVITRTLTTSVGSIVGSGFYDEDAFMDLPSGTYTIETTAPAGMKATKDHVGEWYLDSDLIGTEHLTSPPFRIYPMDWEPNIDAGFVPAG